MSFSPGGRSSHPSYCFSYTKPLLSTLLNSASCFPLIVGGARTLGSPFKVKFMMSSTRLFNEEVDNLLSARTETQSPAQLSDSWTRTLPTSSNSAPAKISWNFSLVSSPRPVRNCAITKVLVDIWTRRESLVQAANHKSSDHSRDEEQCFRFSCE